MTRWLPALAALAALAINAGACAPATAGPELKLGAVPSGVTVTTEMEYYYINAETLFQLRQGLARGPRVNGRQWEAATQSQFHWTFVREQSASGCAARDARVALKVKVVFPRWNPMGDPEPEVYQWWEQREIGLMEHERGHALISAKAAEEIRREIEGISAPTCDLLTSQASTRANRRVALQREEQLDYDRSTRHGATQMEQAGRLRSP